jgi:hypothetical protein
VWIVPLHAGCQRILIAINADLGVQTGALLTAALVNVIYGFLFVGWFVASPPVHPIDLLAGGLFIAVTVNAMAFFYFQFVNVALTSIHMSVLLRIFWAGELPKELLLTDYGDRQMVSERVCRLAQLRQIELQDGMVHLRSHIMLILAAPIYLWRRVLGWSR